MHRAAAVSILALLAALSACGADGNYRDAARFALGDQVAFLADSIDGIYDNVGG